MKRLFLFMSVLMSLVCMMMAAVVLAAAKTNGMAIGVLNTGIEPKYMALILMIFAVVFLFLALRVVMKLKKIIPAALAAVLLLSLMKENELHNNSNIR